jgi:hypothetical protein
LHAPNKKRVPQLVNIPAGSVMGLQTVESEGAMLMVGGRL